MMQAYRQSSKHLDANFWAPPIFLASTAVAYLTVPENVYAVNAILGPAWITALGILAAIAIVMMKRGIEGVLRPVNIVYFGVIVTLLTEPLQPGYLVRSDYPVTQAEFLAMGLFLFCVSVGEILPVPAMFRRVLRLGSANYSEHGLRLVIGGSFFIGMLNYAIASHFSLQIMLQGLTSARFEAAWTRGLLGGWDAFRDFLTYFGYPLPVLTVLLVHRKKRWFRPDVIASLVLTGVFILFLAQGGGRRLVVDIVGAALITYLLANRSKLKLRQMAVAVLIIGGTLSFAQFMLQVRTFGVAATTETRETPAAFQLDDNFWSLGEVIKAVPDEHPYVGWGNIIYVIVRPIPRVFWPGKPADAGFDLAAHLGLTEVIYATTAIGESYFSFGWLGVATGGIVFGLLAAWWASLITDRTSPVGFGLYGLGCMALFLGVRSYIELVLMSYPIVLWLILDQLAGRRLRIHAAHDRQPILVSLVHSHPYQTAVNPSPFK